ncbi:MAG TPA: tRNA (adenosine(37)-N6)-dimethylallyltransferase MiaA [Candidatus Binatia bacterium]|nr:tRNA (adenosine(37)-N6)-dimethylallyltransferase MiaA [Candidatus Binatia bacterium]
MTAPRVVCLVGPTASGKTSLAIELAEVLGGEVVSADSRQVYRRMDVGTAKPTREERRRVPHHCLDLIEPTDSFDAARFRDAAARAVEDVSAHGRVPLVVGGTGLWVRVLLRGLCPAPPRAPAVRAALRALAARRGANELHRHLAAIDPTAAARLHPRDTVRVERALEVAFASGRRLSDWQAAHGFADAPYDALVVGLALETPDLDARIEARARRMVAAGFAEEVRRLRASGLADTAPAWASVGYREMRAYVDGTRDLDSALVALVRGTRRFARRQRTWFRGEPGILWRHPEKDRERVLAEAAAFLARGERPAA